MAAPIFTNYSGPTLAACDQLHFKTDWAAADLATSKVVGPSGIGTSGSTVGMFDLRAYDSAHFYVYTGGYSGTTPSMAATCFFYDQSSYPGDYFVAQASTPSLTTTGGGVMVLMTNNATPQLISAGSTIVQPILIIPKPNFCQFFIAVSGVSGLTSLRTSLYGSR